jgi:hypothetical protein
MKLKNIVKNAAIASALLMASSSASAIPVNISGITFNPIDDTIGDFQWSTAGVPDFAFSSSDTITYGTFTTNSFALFGSETDAFEVSFTLTPPGTLATSVSVAAAFEFGNPALDEVVVNFGNAWVNNGGGYEFRFVDLHLDPSTGTGGNGTYDLTAEFRAVPEPSVLALFGAGLLGMGAIRRRKNKS